MSENTTPDGKKYAVSTPTEDYPGNSLEILHLYKADKTPFVVMSQGAAQADVAALTQAAITGGESPTEAEFNALRTDHAATRTVVNALLAKLRTAGIIAT
jgi:hypothetical protein